MADIGLDRSIQSPSTLLMPTTPLQLSGFLTGDTIQVKGDTGNLKFSVQFSIQDKHIPDQNNNLFNSLGADASYRENENHSCQNSSFSSYVTPPNDVQEVEDQNSQSPEEGDSTRPIVTRLRSGVISPVNYFPRISSSSSSGLRPCESKRNGRKNDDVFERVLRRHRSPIRPCTSYAFFVMATWGFVKSSSFGETSKQLGRMWCQLPPTEKRVRNLAISLSIFNHKNAIQFSSIGLCWNKRKLKWYNTFCSFTRRWLWRTMLGIRGNACSWWKSQPRAMQEGRRCGIHHNYV